MKLEVFHDVACTVCGCVCDDLTVSVSENRVVRVERACSLAEPWFFAHNEVARSEAEVGGAPVNYARAIDEAARILHGAKAPLVYGLSRSSTAGQRAAVRLADYLGGNIDTTASRCHAPSIVAIQSVGESTCSLGEIKNRADLVLFWGVDPAKTHPRHMERYSVEPAGQFIGGREDRTVVVLDIEETETAQTADLFIPIEPGRDFEAICVLRCLLAGHDIDQETVDPRLLHRLMDLQQRMTECRCGVIFFGLGIAQSGIGHANVEHLLRLVAELNQFTRFHARRMRLPGDVTGADCVLCWQTGFPFSVSLNRGYPRYNPGEYSANELLERGEVDACLLVGSEGIPDLSADAQKRLEQLPVITLDYPSVEACQPVRVRLTTAVYGVHERGTAYRMDEVPIPLRAFLQSSYRTDDQVLKDILATCRDLGRR